MRSIHLMFSFAIASILIAPAIGQDVKPEEREKLETLIPAGIRLIEAKEFEKLIKVFAPPEALKEITSVMTMQELVENFKEDKAPQLLTIFKEIKEAKPELSEDGKTAVYKLKESVGSKETVTFRKIEKYWYLEN